MRYKTSELVLMLTSERLEQQAFASRQLLKGDLRQLVRRCSDLLSPHGGASWQLRANLAALMAGVTIEGSVSCLLGALKDEAVQYVQVAEATALSHLWLTMGGDFDRAFANAYRQLRPHDLERLVEVFRSVSGQGVPTAFRQAHHTLVTLSSGLNSEAESIEQFSAESERTRHDILLNGGYTFDGIAFVVDKHGTIRILES